MQKTNVLKGSQLIFSAGGCNGMWVSGMRLCLCFHFPQGNTSWRALQIPHLNDSKATPKVILCSFCYTKGPRTAQNNSFVCGFCFLTQGFM